MSAKGQQEYKRAGVRNGFAKDEVRTVLKLVFDRRFEVERFDQRRLLQRLTVADAAHFDAVCVAAHAQLCDNKHVRRCADNEP